MTTHNSEKTQGIVLKAMPYKESGQLVSVYTLQFGKMTFHARGVRKLTSKNAPSVQSITLSEFELTPRKGISALIRGNGLQFYRHIKEQIECEIVADYLLEYVYRYEEENHPDEEMFMMIKNTLDALDQGYHFLLVYLLINCFILKRNGIDLEVDGCAICGNKKVESFSINNGGFVCHMHNENELPDFTIQTLKALRHIYKCPMKEIGKLHIEEEELTKLMPVLSYYVEEYAGIRLKTQTFVKQIV
ncbi:DNA repair protein RecO [Kandleria vitulina]|jgi:DNA repair protein RecO (recombination protein O)|nr:DNA repair protein RecO [Kandleria vitulina]MEE0987745.1 DNA repair protein RecO [Kandleria vitulina]